MKHFVQAVTLRWYNACAYYAVALTRGLMHHGYKVTFVGGYDTPAVKKARELGCDVFDLPKLRYHGPFSFFTLADVYRKFAFENKVTLVNVHDGRDHLIWSVALRGTGIPLIRTSGNQIPPKNHTGARFLMKKTSGIIATCSTIRNFYTESFGMRPEKIPVIHGGIDSDFYSIRHPRYLLRKKHCIPDNAFVFGIIARFSPDKGHTFFFRAAEIVAKKYPEAWFVVAGWNAQLKEADIRSMASGVGILERTLFPGRYPDSRELISLLDVGVIASVRSETVCRIAMEYMAMGIPVVATDTNVIPEIVRHGRSGFIVQAGNPEAMASAMVEMRESKEKARTFGQNGRFIIESEYTLSSFASQTLRAYGSLTGDE